MFPIMCLDIMQILFKVAEITLLVWILRALPKKP